MMTKTENTPHGMTIRETAPDDVPAVLALYPLAFPEEELRPVVSALLQGGHDILSLAAVARGELIAHVLFTYCGLQEGDRHHALLAPLGVRPAYQGKGVGTAIVRAGVEQLKRSGIARVFVLGDPGYYARFGFAPERRVLPPYPLPDDWADAWQSMPLQGAAHAASGRLAVPGPWMRPDLWG